MVAVPVEQACAHDIGRAAARRGMLHEDRQRRDGEQEAQAMAERIGDLIAPGLFSNRGAPISESK